MKDFVDGKSQKAYLAVLTRQEYIPTDSTLFCLLKFRNV